jgi:Zn-finger nucleic acid-binding protein
MGTLSAFTAVTVRQSEEDGVITQVCPDCVGVFDRGGELVNGETE